MNKNIDMSRNNIEFFGKEINNGITLSHMVVDNVTVGFVSNLDVDAELVVDISIPFKARVSSDGILSVRIGDNTIKLPAADSNGISGAISVIILVHIDKLGDTISDDETVEDVIKEHFKLSDVGVKYVDDHIIPQLSGEFKQ